MKQTEITVQVFNSFEELANILKSQGFKMIENYQINDWYFTKLDNIKDIKYLNLLNNSFLVRQVLSDSEEVSICYKKKEVDEFENVMSEEKIKTFVNSLQKTLDIFKCAGLNNYCTIKNNTFVYQKDKISFAVQVVDNLGVFIEYEEDESMRNLNAKEKFNKMISILNSLNLNIGQDYSCKKVFMLLKKFNQK